AVSGCDVVEKRSNQVQKLRALADRVLEWGERLVFAGVKDDSLPPKVLEAMDAYIQESPCRLLIIMPLADEREGDGKDKPKQPPRSALVMECFEAPPDEAQTTARLEVVARHSTSALYNSMELRRIPFRWIWMPLAKLQEGLGGQTRAITLAVIAGVSILAAALYALPYPLKVDSTGMMLPVVRRVVYAPAPGTIEAFEVQPNSTVAQGRVLARMYDSNLFQKMRGLEAEIQGAQAQADEARKQAARVGIPPSEKSRAESEAALKEIEWKAKEDELNELIRRMNGNQNSPGRFNLVAPTLNAAERGMVGPAEWLVLNSNFQEMERREVRPNEPILRLGVTTGKWEVELKIPQKHIGQVLKAFDRFGRDRPLQVDFLLLSDTTRVFQGKLFLHRISPEATASQDAASESEPVVVAFVEVEDGEIAKDSNVVEQLGRQNLVSGTEIRAKVYCGNHRAGYSLFYGVWEFLYEKVVFFF
ncbi:MAG: hypothetical protein ACRC33_06035, partial [Gemmataceae bacterium]